MFYGSFKKVVRNPKYWEGVNEMKSGKAPGLDGFQVESLKNGGAAVLEWLVWLLNYNYFMEFVPMDWRGACIVPLYKGKGDMWM